VCNEGRRREAAALGYSQHQPSRRGTPYNEFAGPAITRDAGYNDAGELGNYSPVVYR
jgi:hypothetical protein